MTFVRQDRAGAAFVDPRGKLAPPRHIGNEPRYDRPAAARPHLHATAGHASRPSALIMDLLTSDTGRVVNAVAPTLDLLYPCGTRKFHNRLADVLAGEASCLVAWAAGLDDLPSIVGVAVSSPKSPARSKLSTIWVAESHRGTGIGTDLLAMSMDRWRSSGVERAHVTVRLSRVALLEPLMSKFNFRYVTTVDNRYGPGRHESVFAWSGRR